MNATRVRRTIYTKKKKNYNYKTNATKMRLTMGDNTKTRKKII